MTNAMSQQRQRQRERETNRRTQTDRPTEINKHIVIHWRQITQTKKKKKENKGEVEARTKTTREAEHKRSEVHWATITHPTLAAVGTGTIMTSNQGTNKADE